MIRLICILVLIVGVFSWGLAQEAKRIATIKEITGTVEVKPAKAKWMPAKVGMVISQGDTIRTKANSSAILNLDGKAETATVQVKANSQLTLAELVVDPKKNTQKTLLDLPLGAILIKAKKLNSELSSFEVKTPTSIVGVRGTTFAVSVEAIE